MCSALQIISQCVSHVQEIFFSGWCLWLWCLSTRGQERPLKLLVEKLHQRCYPRLLLRAAGQDCVLGTCGSSKESTAGTEQKRSCFPKRTSPEHGLQDIPKAERRDPAHGLLPGYCGALCSSPLALMCTVGEGWPRDSTAQSWAVALSWPHSQKDKVPKFLGTGGGGR